jgi:hypothetical protein
MTSLATRSLLLALLALLSLAACYQPSFDSCGVRCGSSGCPSGTECGTDGYCHAGAGETCTAGPEDDAALADAAADASSDASGDGGVPPGFVPRLIANAYYSGGGATGGMSPTGFSIQTAGVVDGDLVLFIASIDNGNDMAWPSAVGMGFHQLAQKFFGIDGQTYVAQWKIADHEPETYFGDYGAGINSADTTISLIAIAGASTAMPINAFVHGNGGNTGGTSPVVGNSVGVTTTVPGCLILYAGGADWQAANGTTTFTAPAGFTKVTAFGDHGDASFEWTSQQVDYKLQAAAGPTGTLSGKLESTVTGIPWSMVIAVAPK